MFMCSLLEFGLRRSVMDRDASGDGQAIGGAPRRPLMFRIRIVVNNADAVRDEECASCAPRKRRRLPQRGRRLVGVGDEGVSRMDQNVRLQLLM
jgi:hypothetical protein